MKLSLRERVRKIGNKRGGVGVGRKVFVQWGLGVEGTEIWQTGGRDGWRKCRESLTNFSLNPE